MPQNEIQQLRQIAGDLYDANRKKRNRISRQNQEIKRLQAGLYVLKDRIHEIAVKHAADYPGITTVDALEQLYAVACTLEGREAALGDWNRLAKYLSQLHWGSEWRERMLAARKTVKKLLPEESHGACLHRKSR